MHRQIVDPQPFAGFIDDHRHPFVPRRLPE
jgi:hypothetical protein